MKKLIDSLHNCTVEKLTSVKLHPASIGHLHKGHPWVTADSYSAKFPRDYSLITYQNAILKKTVGILINDPMHPTIKARIWKFQAEGISGNYSFWDELKLRLFSAFQKRLEIIHSKSRDNVIMLNAENDFIPGLILIKFKDQYILQCYTSFWQEIKDLLIDEIQNQLERCSLVVQKIWFQNRNWRRQKEIENEIEQQNFTIKEFDINFSIKINSHYDFGIYTDMSAIRTTLIPWFKNRSNFLNLFCYTGAFSLFALKHGIKEVISVDLSQKYLNWLQENLQLNPSLLAENTHQSLNLSAEKAIEQLLFLKKEFSLILCDPPSFSSDGKTQSSALEFYEKNLPAMLKLLADDGVLLIFINTHSISLKKFEIFIQTVLNDRRSIKSITIQKGIKMTEDVLPHPSFIEGNYIKGLILKKRITHK